MEFKKDFDTLTGFGENVFKIRGSTIVAELLPDPEFKTASGLIMASPSDHAKGSMKDNMLQAAVVLATGPGYWDEESRAYEALEVSPGAVVVVPQYSAQFISVFPSMNKPTKNKLVLLKMDSVLCYFPSKDAFDMATRELSGANR